MAPVTLVPGLAGVKRACNQIAYQCILASGYHVASETLSHSRPWLLIFNLEYGCPQLPSSLLTTK